MTEEAIVCGSCSAQMPAKFKFCAECGSRLGADPAPAPVVAAAPASTLWPAGSPAEPGSPSTPGPNSVTTSALDVATDERRDVTVLFADVSGFTAMSERLDPETVHRIMNDCFDGLGAAIAAEGGHIDKYIGDNVMALFGAPVAHADDPARAARAALMMQAFLAEFAERNRERAGVTFRMRIGIHCGLVLAGRVGASVRRDYSVMGDAVNLASRLESNARPGAILVSRDMMRRLRGQFAFGPALQLEVKGKAGAVEAAELLRELSEVERGADPAGELPFVGRAAEVEQLCTSWRHASSTAPATIVGPSGIGKTRLVRAAADAAGVSLLSVSARPATRRRPMALVRRIVQAVRAHVAPAAPRPDCLESFAASLAAVSDGLQPYLGALWYLSAADGLAVEPPDPDPRVLRQTLREGVARLLANLRRHDPGLVLFLDCYDDCDGASAELLRDLPAVGDPPPIVVVRREWDGAPPGDPVLRLGPLAPAEADALLDRLDHARALHPTLRGDVLRRAQGVPLYLHEILLKLVDAGVLRQTDDGWTCDPQASAAILPESLFGAMVARVDALEPPLRRLLLECSVQGIEFDAPVAAAVAAQRGGRRETVADGEAEVRRALAMLRDRTLVDVDTIRSDQWSFRQALLQAACYETLLLTERRRLHGETGHAIVRRAGGREAVAPELLAYHFETAEDWAEAAAANVRAGARAAELFANAEAADRYRRAIRFAGLAGDAAAGAATAARDAAARLHLRLGDYGEVERHARWLIDSGGGAADRATGLGHLAAVRFHAGRPDEAERHLRDAVACLDEKDASGAKVLARLHFDLAQIALRAARLAQAQEHATASRRLGEASDRAAAVRLDILEGRLAHTAGRFGDAARSFRAAYDAAEALGSLSEQARACNYMGDAARDRGDYADAEALFGRALDLWTRIGDAEGVAGANNNLANLAMSRGDLAGAAHRHRLALDAFAQIGNVNGEALARANLAILALERGEPADAVVQAGRALALLGDPATAFLHALTRVVLGEGHLAEGDLDAAERVFRNVLDDAPPPLAVAGADRGLGRIAAARGDVDHARRLLQAALTGFERLERTQEAARTMLDLAETDARAGEAAIARDRARAACRLFIRIGAQADAARAEALVARLSV